MPGTAHAARGSRKRLMSILIVFQAIDIPGQTILCMARLLPLRTGEMAIIVLAHRLQFRLRLVVLVR